MRLLKFLLAFSVSISGYSQISDAEVRDLKGGNVQPDTTPIYQLPYEVGKKYLLIQGWQSSLSHKGEIAQDFKMRRGTKIFAARKGVVVQVKSDGTQAGLKSKYLGEGNNVVIMHADSTFAGYWHLKHNGPAVNVGDSVDQGEFIGYSGHTGYSAFPHLHFMVFKYEKGIRRTIPIRYLTKKGPRYIRPGNRYTCVRVQQPE